MAWPAALCIQGMGRYGCDGGVVGWGWQGGGRALPQGHDSLGKAQAPTGPPHAALCTPHGVMLCAARACWGRAIPLAHPLAALLHAGLRLVLGILSARVCARLTPGLQGWYVSYDLGTQLAQGMWNKPAAELLHDITDHDMLKTLIEAVQDNASRAMQGQPGSPQPDIPMF